MGALLQWFFPGCLVPRIARKLDPRPANTYHLCGLPVVRARAHDGLDETDETDRAFPGDAMTSAAPRDFFRPVLAILLIVALVGLSLWVIRPFLPAVIWATMIVVASWPLMVAAQRRLWGRRWLAVTAMTVALLLVFVIPLSLAVGTIVAHVDDITGWASSLESTPLNVPPPWVADIPLVGERLAAAWSQLPAEGELKGRIAPHMSALAAWFVAQVGGLGAVVAQFLLTVAIAAILFARGEVAARGILALARRVGDEHGESSVRLAGQAIRGVALGVVVTALVQSALGGIGLAIAGVPFAALLTAIMFLLAVAQIGAVPVLACGVAFLFYRDDTPWAIALLVWTVVVGSLDNVLRPILIRRGADLPLLLIFAGVIGGLIAFGLVGIFIGPMVLAVTWTLCTRWVAGTAPVIKL
jgi:predicted PurR-regulated permease PerM